MWFVPPSETSVKNVTMYHIAKNLCPIWLLLIVKSPKGVNYNLSVKQRRAFYCKIFCIFGRQLYGGNSIIVSLSDNNFNNGYNIMSALSSNDGLPPPPPHSRLINFDMAEIRASQFNDDLFLVVSGEHPQSGWSAVLAPQINQDKSDYLFVEVIRVHDNDGQVERNNVIYQLSLPLNAISGEIGVAVVGANGTKYIDK